MLIFIDESGDPGFKFAKNSSTTFTLAAIMFEKQKDADFADQTIDKTRFKLGLKQRYEFHFSQDGEKIRQAFLQEIKQMNFSWVCIHVDKVQLIEKTSANLADSELFLTIVCRSLFHSQRKLLKNSIIRFDQSKRPLFYRDLQNVMKKEFNEDYKRIKKIKPQDSAKNNLLQLVDYYAGVIANHFNNNDKNNYWRFVDQNKGFIEKMPK